MTAVKDAKGVRIGMKYPMSYSRRNIGQV